MDYIDQANREIEEWENEKPGFLNRTADFLLWPAEKAAGALIPVAVQETVGNAIQACLSGLASQTTWTFHTDAIAQSISTRCCDLGGNAPTLANRLQAADESAREFWHYHIAYAAAEGGATGAAGFFGRPGRS